MNAQVRERIVGCFPRYPESIKSEYAYAKYQARWRETHNQNWARWIKLLCEPPPPRRFVVRRTDPHRRYLIRLPGGHYAQPRGELDFQYHVPPKTKKKKLTLSQQIKIANRKITDTWKLPNPFL